MPKLGKLKIAETEISQTINLKEIFGKDFSKVPNNFKQALGQAFIDQIVERTKSGKGLNPVTGRNIKLRSPYSKEYANSLEFDAAGKSRNNVNLTLSGDMLRSIDVLDVKANTIKIGIDDTEEAAKAHGHQTGKNGEVPRMKRPFFGLSASDLKSVVNEVKPDVNKIFREKGAARNKLLDALAAKILESGQDGES